MIVTRILTCMSLVLFFINAVSTCVAVFLFGDLFAASLFTAGTVLSVIAYALFSAVEQDNKI